MSTSEIILELLKYTVPAALVLAGVTYVLRSGERKAETKAKYGIYQKTFADLVPLRLQAYERAVLFLERISPENLLLRVDGRGKTVRQFHSELIAEIRSEYEHNIAQQLYIKEESWQGLVRAKDQIISLVNTSTKGISADGPGIDLGKKVLNKMVESESAPTHEAIRILKGDIQAMFRF